MPSKIKKPPNKILSEIDLVAWPTFKPKSHKKYKVFSIAVSDQAVFLYGNKKRRSISDPGAKRPLPYPPVAKTEIFSASVGLLSGCKYLLRKSIIKPKDHFLP